VHHSKNLMIKTKHELK